LNQSLSVIVVWAVAVLALRHTRSLEALRASERTAYGRLAQLRTTYASAPVGLCFLDRDLRYLAINNTLADMLGRSPDYYLGKTITETTHTFGVAGEEHYRRVLHTGRPVLDVELEGSTEAHPDEKRFWLASYHPVKDENGSVMGVNVAVRDITDRKQAEADTLFLLDVGECIRVASDAEEMMWAIAVALGEHLGAGRCTFAEVDLEQRRIVVRRDYHRHLPSLVGSYSFQQFHPALVEAAKTARTVLINDVLSDERVTVCEPILSQLGIKGFIAVPLLRDGQFVCCLLVASPTPHAWTERATALVNAVAERTWLAAERLRLEQALRESEAALREADRRKDEFLATLAHELRNPLSLVRNVISLLQSPEASEAEAKWGRNIIDKQVDYLTRLTDDLFDISRITRDQLELRKQEIELHDVIHAAVEASRPLIEQRGHDFTMTVPSEPVYLFADSIRLTQALMNLLNNAAKYTQTGGKISLTAEREDGAVVLRVKDTGIGIAATDLKRVFDLFFQVDRSFARAEGGLGLGLTLVRRLVALHGGTVDVRSDGRDRGSEFIVRLPTIAKQDAPAYAQAAGDAGPGAAARRRILVADDFPESAQLLARLLRRDGNDVRVALDGLEAVEAAREFQPHIILLDIAMPKLDGYEAATQIRKQGWGKNAILIALTGWGQQQARFRTKEAGFDVHLTKPVNYQAISRLLNELCAHGHFAQERETVLLSPSLQAADQPTAKNRYDV
jgi:PAS domain S-box-containing protein